MMLKSYFSGTVEAAMELARKEMGDDALLVHVRPTTPETRMFGAFEVVFGIPPTTPQPVQSPLPAAQGLAARGGNREVDGDRDANGNREAERQRAVDRRRAADGKREAPEKRELQRAAEGARGVSVPGVDLPGVSLLGGGRQSAGLPAVNPPPSHAPVRQRLSAAELDPELARQVEQGAALEDLFEVDATLGRRGGARAVVALVGPPGSGKTTTLVKLAALRGLAARRPVHLVSADVYRIAAADQLQSLASILGIGCTIAETPAALRKALEGRPAGELLLIDTPGLGPGDMGECAGLMRLIGSHPEIDVHLVLPATLQSAILRQAIDRYEPFRPQKLLFTHIDESSHFGSLINQSARCSLPVSFLSTGQRIPDDLEPATKPRLCALVHGNSGPPETSVGAAA